MLNPHATTYFSYVTLILDQSIDAVLPPWLPCGVAEMLSNTIVREANVLVGTPIQGNLQLIAERSRLRVPQLIQVKAKAPDLSTQDGLEPLRRAVMGAGAHADVRQGWRPRESVESAVPAARRRHGRREGVCRSARGLPRPSKRITTSICHGEFDLFVQLNVDASVKKEGFSQRDVSPSEAAALRSLWATATGRPIEARAAFAEARKGDAGAETYAAEGLLLEREGKLDEAKAAYEQAAAAGSKSLYAHYRLATLCWGPNPSQDTLKGIRSALDAGSGVEQPPCGRIRDAWRGAAAAWRYERGRPGHSRLAARTG